MARLTFPTRPDLMASMATSNGAQRYVDGYADATADADHLTVALTDAETGHRLVLTWATEPTQRWTLTASHPEATDHEPLALPEPLIARANRLMSAEGVTITRDWRTKTHTLRAANRQVIPLTHGDAVAAALTATGWRAMPERQAATLPAPTTPAPSAPTPSPAPASAPTPAPTGTSQVMPPQGIPAAYVGTIVLSKQARAKWDMARAVHRTGEPEVVAMIGPSGAGKTHAVHALAAAEGLDVVKFDASGVVEPGDWFGTVTLDGNGTRFVPSDLLLAITAPGARVLLIDEVNRANLRALNAMLPLLDGSGTVTIPQSGKRERVNRQVQVVVTANIGSAFLGTEPLDEAVRTRVGTWIEVDHLTEDEERRLLLDRVEGLSEWDAGNLARLGAVVRASATNGQHPPVSTRQLLSAARKMAVGGDPRLAVEAAVLDGYLSEGGSSSERAKVRTHVAGITWVEPKPVQPGVPGTVYTGSGTCRCGHPASDHGIGSDVSVSTHCRVCAHTYPGSAVRQCPAYSEEMDPA